MQVIAKAKFIRTSPRKIRLVVDVVRGLRINEALDNLRLMNKKAAGPVMKIIQSAIGNAEHNYELDKDNLFIKEIRVDEAPTLKRWRPRAHGRATNIRKRNSHITVLLGEIKDSGARKAKKVELEAPVKLGQTPKERKDDKYTETKAPGGDNISEDLKEEKGKEIIDVRREGRGGHARAEGGKKGFSSKIFRRKSG